MKKRLSAILAAAVLFTCILLQCCAAAASGHFYTSLLSNWTDRRFRETYGVNAKSFVPSNPQPLQYIVCCESVIDPVTRKESEGGWSRSHRTWPASVDDVLEKAGDLSDLSLTLTDDPNEATFRAVITFKYSSDGKFNYKSENARIPMYKATLTITLINMVTKKSAKASCTCWCFTEDRIEKRILDEGIGKRFYAGPRTMDEDELTPLKKLVELSNDVPFEYTDDEGGGVCITKYTGTKQQVTIPDRINGKPVTGLGHYALGEDKIKSVKLPDTLVHIDEKAFFYTPITAIDFPESLTVIDGLAFEESELEKVILPDSVTQLGFGAFSRCGKLKTVQLSQSLTVIPENCFFCSGLTSVEIPDSVTEIGESAFNSCYQLTTITLPESLAVLGDLVFSECEKLKEITLPKGISAIPVGAFNYSGLTEITCLGEIEEVGSRAFAMCKSLATVRFAGGVKKISEGAFAGCESLKELDLSGVTTIENGAFSECTSLQNVILSETLEKMSKRPFGDARPGSEYYPLPEGFHFTVPAGSYAETWAKENGYPYEVLP